MNNIVQPLLRDFNPPYIGKGLVILWFIMNHDFHGLIDIKNGILEIYHSSIPTGDGLIAFGLERDIDKNDNLVRHNWVLKTVSEGVRVDLKQYGYEAPDGIPYHDSKRMTDPSYWYRKTIFFQTTHLVSGIIEGTVYQRNMLTFKQMNNQPGRNILGCNNYDLGIRSLLGEGKLELVAAHHGCDYTCWGGFGTIINFDIARYNKEKKLGILYYNIPNYKIVNNVNHTPLYKEVI